MQSRDNTRAGGAQARLAGKKPHWKRSEKGYSYLSFFGLKVTVFPNRRLGGWIVCIKENDEPPEYSNYTDEMKARAEAERIFAERKSSGKFGAPQPVPLRDRLQEIVRDGRVAAEFECYYVEIGACLERQHVRADLFRFDTDGRLYWVPHSHGVVADEQLGHCRLVVTRWWLDNAKPVR